MRINHTSIDFRRPDLAQVQGGGTEQAGKDKAAQPASAVQRADKVQISDAGRQLAAQASQTEGAQNELSAERINEIRDRVLQGAYNSLEIVDEVARRMLERGDI